MEVESSSCAAAVVALGGSLVTVSSLASSALSLSPGPSAPGPSATRAAAARSRASRAFSFSFSRLLRFFAAFLPGPSPSSSPPPPPPSAMPAAIARDSASVIGSSAAVGGSGAAAVVAAAAPGAADAVDGVEAAAPPALVFAAAALGGIGSRGFGSAAGGTAPPEMSAWPETRSGKSEQKVASFALKATEASRSRRFSASVVCRGAPAVLCKARRDTM